MIRILAIDDNKDNIIVLHAILSDTMPDAVLYHAESGFHGLKLMKELSPHVILLDLIMPMMDGFDVLKKIRSGENPDYIPVIMITAIGESREKRIKALELGADAFLSKPVDEAELTAQIRAMIRIREMEELKRHEAERLSLLVDERTKALRKEIREHERTEIILKESELRFRTVFEKSELGIVLVSPDMKYLKVNPSFCGFTGYTECELLSMTVKDITVPEDFIQSKLAGEKLWAGEIASYHAEKRYLHKTGSLVWALIVVSVIRNNEGQPMFYLTMVNDITAKKTAEEQLAKEQVLFKTLIDYLPQTIYVKDLQKRKILANKADLEIIGKTEMEVIGKTDQEVFPKELAKRYETDDDLVFSTRCPIIDREEIIMTKDGNKLWFLTSKIPLFDHTGNLTGLVGIGHDITTRKLAEIEVKESELRLKKQNHEYLRLNKEYVVLNNELLESLNQIKKMNYDLQLAKAKAEEGEKLKTAFLHNISHEIRTPLNAIIGFTSVLTREDLSPVKRKEFSEIIYKSNDQLLSIINSIISLASLESGQENCTLIATDINQLILDVYEQFMVEHISPDVSFTYFTGMSDLRAHVMTDPVKLMQILANIVSNALKFTSKGYVKIGYALSGDMIEFSVEDSGIGIPEEMHEIVFERFRQVDNSETRKYGGTGLGLALSKGYAELLGGNIHVFSSPGKGSKFIISIPFIPVVKVDKINPRAMMNHKSKIPADSKILIAEDEYNNFLMLNEMLNDLRLKVFRAENGLEALNFCLGDINPDLVLMDMKMPVMDGEEATLKIKKIKPQIPVVAVSAYTTESDKQRFYKAGCDDFIEKPVRRENLIRVMEKHLNVVK